MFCNKCYNNEAYIFLDCYCIFCLDCYDNKIEFLIKERKRQLEKQKVKTCQFCQKKTNFKLCDKRKQQDRETIRQLTIHPDKANLRAVETTKFHFLQKKKEIEFLKKKNNFMNELIIYLMQTNHKSIKNLPDNIIQEDQYNYLDQLREKVESFHIDQIQNNENYDFYQNSTRNVNTKNQSEFLYKQDTNKNTNQNSYQQSNIKRYSSGKNFLNFQLKSIKEEKDQLQKQNIEAVKKYKLQSILMKDSNFVTPFIRKR